jgi:putative addiction module component (TIGR02574 family)
MTTEALASAALALPPESRAALAELLLSSLESPIDVKYREEWEQEIEDRLDAYDRGEMKAYSRDEVMRILDEDAGQ